MERIAVGSVALGVAVMILALAVVIGFKREIARKMEGFAAHVSVTDIRGVETLDAHPVHRSARLEALIRATDGFVDMTPYAAKGGIIRTDEAVGEVVLKGVGGDYDFTLLKEWLVEGEMPRIGDSIRTKGSGFAPRSAASFPGASGSRLKVSAHSSAICRRSAASISPTRGMRAFTRAARRSRSASLACRRSASAPRARASRAGLYAIAPHRLILS